MRATRRACHTLLGLHGHVRARGLAELAGAIEHIDACFDTVSPIEDEAVLVEKSRIAVGASYWGVLDLSGSIWERVITVGHPTGRAFRGTMGDGRLSPETSSATNLDWPHGSGDGHEVDGIGFRGGAEYFAPNPDLTNPFSIVGGRKYAAWNGAHAAPTYGARGVRNAE